MLKTLVLLTNRFSLLTHKWVAGNLFLQMEEAQNFLHHSRKLKYLNDKRKSGKTDLVQGTEKQKRTATLNEAITVTEIR